ncbi:immunoglobulin light chain variable region [Sigmodon hispidus]
MAMLPQAKILSLLLLWISDSRAETTVTQSPAFLSMTPGETVSIACRTSTDIDDMNWYQHKPGEAPKLLISEGNKLNSGVPSRFSSSGYGTDFTMTINGMHEDDAGIYFCLQSDNLPLTVKYPLTETSDALSSIHAWQPLVFILSSTCILTSFFTSLASTAPILFFTLFTWKRLK